MTDEEGVWRRPQQRHRRIQEEETQKTNYTNGEEGSASTTTDIMQERLPKGIFGITLCLGLVATLMSLGSCVFIYIHRTNKLIAIGQPPFLYLICFGCILLSSQIFFLFRYDVFGAEVEDDGETKNQKLLDATCVVDMWFTNIGAILIHMAIFCKLWRAHKVTQFRKKQRILAKHVIAPFVLVLLLAIGLTISRTILDPPFWTTETNLPVYDDGIEASNDDDTIDGNNTNFAFCQSESALENDFEDTNPYGWIQWAIVLLDFVSLAIMLWMAWVTRKIPEDISDSRRVCHIVCANCCVAATTFVLLFIGLFLHSASFIIATTSIAQFVNVFVIVGFLLFPKIYNVCYEKRHDGRLPQGFRTASPAANYNGGGNVHVTGVTPAVKLQRTPTTTLSKPSSAMKMPTTTKNTETNSVVSNIQLPSSAHNKNDDEGILSSSCEVSSYMVDAVDNTEHIVLKMHEDGDNDDDAIGNNNEGNRSKDETNGQPMSS